MPLRLRSLELHGYKTFAAHTTFEFAAGITAIVGPNGSGKSNIADAFRWVLGEQSFSLLRAKRTEDMIFSGSEQRSRAGMASVNVIFDNGNGWLPLDFSEVSLARRAYRDGRNEYLLNNQHVRLREINELLAPSGLSERTYTILGQGLVDASLALKADERRRLFEEAAGVGLYRARREETLRRLETTQRNLERVQDIMAELAPRLRSLERQARRAQEYAQAQADLRVLLRDWYGYHWHRTQKELAGSRAALREQEARLREARQTHQKAQADYAAFRARVHDLRLRLNGWHRQSSDLHSRRETLSRDLAVLDERRRALLETQALLSADLDRLRDEERLSGERLAAMQQETSRLQTEADEAKQQHSEAQQALQARQTEREALETKLGEARSQLTALVAERAETQARLDEITARLAAWQQKQTAAEEAIRSAEATLKQAEAQERTARAARSTAEQAARGAEAAFARARQGVVMLEGQRRERLDERAHRQTEHSRLQAQLEVLEQAEQSLSGYAEGARFLLEAARQARLKGTRGALSAMLEVPAEYETAITAALGDRLDAVVLDAAQVESALRLLESDQAGRAAILPLDGLANAPTFEAPQDDACLGIASEFVKAPQELRGAIKVLLGTTLLVRDRAAARRLIQGQPTSVRAVTLRGEVFRGDGLILAGGNASSGTLSRPRQRRELQQALAKSVKEIEALDVELTRLENELAAAQSKQTECEQALRGSRLSLEEAQAGEQQAGLESESARRQVEWQRSQRDALQVESVAAESDHRRLSESLAEVESRSMQAQEEARALSAQLAELVLDELQGQAAYWATRAAVAEQALSDAQAREAVGRQNLEGHAARRRELEQRLEESGRSLAALESEKASLREQEAQANAEIEALREQIEPAEQELESAEGEEARLQSDEDNAQRNLAVAERLFGQLQLEGSRRQESLDALRQRIEDDFGLVQFEYETDVSGPQPLPLDGFVEQLPVIQELPPELEEQIAQQRARLRRMGPVNPEAQSEYEAESERYAFMQTQIEDLHKAGADLRQVIAELDDLTKREFQRTFEAVDREFRQIFVRLFGGGSARLALTDPDNLVETGIEIEARLPGRREQGLALLSGGERSLTAIALVFALLKVSPTPVCVLDEVDAMLDEANVGRFRDLLAELSRETQFIIITHNRSTIQAADVIYGVTMGRDSTSQVISLRLDEVTEEFIG